VKIAQLFQLFQSPVFQLQIKAVFVESLTFGDLVEEWITMRASRYLIDWIGVKIGYIDNIATFAVSDTSYEG